MLNKIILLLLLAITIIGFLGGYTCGYIRGTTRMVAKDIEILKLQIQLADPHHCVSVCAEYFEKMGR